MEKTMSENQKPAGVPVDMSRVKENARLLARWTGRPLSACQELTARAMDVTSWQKLLTVPYFVPDEHLTYWQAGSLVDTRAERIVAQANLLKVRLEIPAGTALKLAAFWQPTALKKTASVIFQLHDSLEPSNVDRPLPATWLNSSLPAKALLALAPSLPGFAHFETTAGLTRRAEAFHSIVRDGITFHGLLYDRLGGHLHLMAEYAGTHATSQGSLGWVALGPGSLQYDDEGRCWLTKYVSERPGAPFQLTAESAFDVVDSFGLTDFRGLEKYRETGAVGFFGSQAALGLIHWLTRHPRKAARLIDAGNVDMGRWHNKTMLRLEFELVHAGLLD
jgi:hypothetical protein